MTSQNPDLPDGIDGGSKPTDPRAARQLLVWGVALALLGIALVAVATLGLLPFGENSLVRHGPQLIGILMISQGAYWVARSRSHEDDGS
ncbi:hypothetical protein ACFYNY_07095 [Streptomyces sp. NPDC006530]|uniref:hypothetical protein n=1 Tax=Streptomyces sp. NPDC006530 TaxID=3364750 RepID=UPI00367B752D